jgi:hypothetical protein
MLIISNAVKALVMFKNCGCENSLRRLSELTRE